MDLELAEHVAVIIGGAKGIGLAIANAFAAENANVAVIDVDSQVVAVAEELNKQRDAKPLAIVADATDESMINNASETVMSEFRRCDHVVYAAGVGSGKYGFPFWNLQPQDWRRVIDVNLLGAVNVTHAFAPKLVDARSGTFLFLSSIAGQIGSQTDPPYSAAKAAVINFAQCAAKDLAEYNVRVNTICPGMVKTELNQSVWQAWNDQQPDDAKVGYDEWAKDKIESVAPLRRWQTCEDIAAMTVFLASSQAKNITGQTINVDGGQVMHW